MAESMASSTGTANHNVSFNLPKFDSYPWLSDRQFLTGVASMLGPVDAEYDQASAEDVSLQARCWWFQAKANITVLPTDYKAALDSFPGHVRPDSAIVARVKELQARLAQMEAEKLAIEAAENSNVFPWQANAPKMELKVDRKTATKTDGTGPDAPYPERFAAVIEAVTTGKPVAGIREIPDTTVRQPGVTPFGKLERPRKPWETATTSSPELHEFESGTASSSIIDDAFPALDKSSDEAVAKTVQDVNPGTQTA